MIIAIRGRTVLGRTHIITPSTILIVVWPSGTVGLQLFHTGHLLRPPRLTIALHSTTQCIRTPVQRLSCIQQTAQPQDIPDFQFATWQLLRLWNINPVTCSFGDWASAKTVLLVNRIPKTSYYRHSEHAGSTTSEREFNCVPQSRATENPWINGYEFERNAVTNLRHLHDPIHLSPCIIGVQVQKNFFH